MRAATVGEDHRADERRLRMMLRGQDDYWMRRAIQGVFVVLAALVFTWLIQMM
jgi:hypothetical protein